MDDPFATEWPDDDLLRIDPHTLFQPEDPNIFSQFPYDAYTTFTDTDSLEGGQTTPPDPGVFDSGYISSNSSDSGKHSPSGSMDSAENSPWVFPPFQNDQGFYQQQGMESEEMTYAPITPKASPIQPTSVRKITPRPAQPTSTTKKYVYIVPKTEPKRFCSPQAAVPGSYVIGSPVYVKAEPAITPIYVKQEQAPIFIAQQPIQALPRKLVLAQPEDESERKLEDRKAKNRAFAQASRLKKKAEIEELKQTITDLQEENGVLREENECLKMRLSRYEFTQTSQPPSRKRVAVAGTLMMAVFMVMAVNPISFDSTPARSVSQVVNTTRVQPTGRVLNADIIQTLPVNASSLTNCASRKFYNSTEAIRLNSDLYDWVDRHETMSLGLKGKHRLLQKKQKDWLSALGSARVNVTETEKNATKVEKKPKDRLWRHLDMISGGTTRRDRARKFLKTDKQDYYSRKAYEKLTAAIQQKEDTLYVLALEDYFLLPALERNFTATPKVTLILPALSHNSTAVGKVPLMRIDLRVVGTGLFQLSRQLLPPQLH